MNVKQVLRPF